MSQGKETLRVSVHRGSPCHASHVLPQGGTIETEREFIYMDQAPGFEIGNPGKLYKLHNAIYGLRQSARNWNEYLDSTLQSLGFNRSVADNCMYIKGSEDKQECCLSFVDDMLYVVQRLCHSASSEIQSERSRKCANLSWGISAQNQ